MSNIGPQIHNYHSVTRLFVCYSGHHSVNGPFGYWTHIHHLNTRHVRYRMPTAFQLIFYFRTRCMKLGSKIPLAWRLIAIQNFPKLVSEIKHRKKTSTPAIHEKRRKKTSTPALYIKTSNSALLLITPSETVLELKWLLFTLIFIHFKCYCLLYF